MNISEAFYSWHSRKRCAKIVLEEKMVGLIVTVFFSEKIVLILQIFGF